MNVASSTQALRAEMRMGYDSVEVSMPEGNTKIMKRAEFEKLPLRNRVDWIMHGKLKFYLNGDPIPATQALKG
jgi:hypothetical protein